MADTVVVLKMVLQAPLILECAEAEIAVNLMIPSVVDMVL
jgi:hypothetical protein